MWDAEDDCDDYEESVYFTGCTCDHEQDEHGWGCCKVPNCDCEGGWEE